MQGEFSLGDLAVRFGLELRGDPGLKVSRVATLSHAGAGALSFLANPRYRKQMESTRATAVLVGPENAASCPVAALIDQFYSEVQKMGGGRWDTSSLLARLER